MAEAYNKSQAQRAREAHTRALATIRLKLQQRMGRLFTNWGRSRITDDMLLRQCRQEVKNAMAVFAEATGGSNALGKEMVTGLQCKEICNDTQP